MTGMDFEIINHTLQLLQTEQADISPDHFAEEISKDFMQRLTPGNGDDADFRIIDILCEMALYACNASARKAAVNALYKNIVEPLCDDFTTIGVRLCNLVLLRMIDFIRKKKEGNNLELLLNQLGYSKQKLLLERYETIHQNICISEEKKEKIRKVIILSRVTVGADVAITSIMVHRLSRSFPQADIIVYGPAHLPEIFYGLPRVHWTKFHYQRDGGLVGRLTSYTNLHHQLKTEYAGTHDGLTFLFDPDSRLSQLSLLPLLPDSQTRHFPSRIDQDNTASRLSQLTNRWLNEVLDEQINILPQISIRPVHQNNIKQFFSSFPEDFKKIVINLGVGNDYRKRLPDPFEENLLTCLLKNDKVVVVLDSGCHPDERDRARELMKIVQTKKILTAAVSEKNLTNTHIPFHHGLICVQGGIGMLSALIDQADVFFGYDSCCQHLATARGTPSVICFAGAPNDRFFDRWRPLDKYGSTQTYRITDSTSLSTAELTDLADKFCTMIMAAERPL